MDVKEGQGSCTGASEKRTFQAEGLVLAETFRGQRTRSGAGVLGGTALAKLRLRLDPEVGDVRVSPRSLVRACSDLCSLSCLQLTEHMHLPVAWKSLALHPELQPNHWSLRWETEAQEENTSLQGLTSRMQWKRN